VFCVADQNRSSMQIFDLKYLPDSVHKVYEDSSLAINTHSFFIEAKSKRMYMCSNRYGNWTKENGNESAMDIISIENPEKPTFLAKLFVPKRANGEAAFRWVHEAHVRNDTAYLSCGYSGLYIYDLRDLNNQIILGTIVNYPQAAYNHSSWLNKNGNYLMFTDENIGSNIKIFDISIIQAPRIESYFISNTWATPHNSYWFGSFAVASMYHDGVYIWNIADTKKPQLAAFYDTYPQNAIGDYTKNFAGCWGVWPYLPSGNIIASDRTNGIFVLKADSGILNTNEILQTTKANIYPNPANDLLNIAIETNYADNFTVTVFDLQGNAVKQFNQHFKSNYLYTEDINDLKSGLYFLEIKGNKQVIRQKLLKQ
jgi:choice-of-anchor B domain-containing protein